jgi:hypothetical protein
MRTDAVMVAAVLNSPIAIDASIQVVRAFVRLRAMVVAHEEPAQNARAREPSADGHVLELTRIGLQDSMRRFERARCTSVAQPRAVDPPRVCNDSAPASDKPLLN